MTSTKREVDGARGEEIVRSMLGEIGEDAYREGLADTPRRVVSSWRTLFSGYKMDPAQILSRKFARGGYDQVISLTNIELYSTCEHHLLPFVGKAHVAYLPVDDAVVGLSKLARLVECFARRLQIQERLTNQIADAVVEYLSPNVAVLIEARHFCMMARGVQKQNSVMVTSDVRGVFRSDASTRSEFYSLVERRKDSQ